MKQRELNYLLFFLGVGYLVLILLKITDTITLSWAWILSPLWVLGGGLCLIIFLLGAFLSGILVSDTYEDPEDTSEPEPYTRWKKVKKY